MSYSKEHKEHIEYTFVAFCKVVLRNAALSAYRDIGRRRKHEISLDYLMSERYYNQSICNGQLLWRTNTADHIQCMWRTYWNRKWATGKSIFYFVKTTAGSFSVAEYKLQLPDKAVLQKKLQELINMPLIEEYFSLFWSECTLSTFFIPDKIMPANLANTAIKSSANTIKNIEIKYLWDEFE